MWSALRRGQWSRSLHAFRSFATVSSQSGVPAGFEELRVLPTLRRYVRGKKAVKELRQQDIIVLTCARPPVSYLLMSLVLQAVLATWFFGATQGAGYGWAVGVLSFAAVASTLLHGILRQPRPKPGPGKPLPWLRSNERGVRLTTLESGPENGRTAGACNYHYMYKLMAE